MCIEGSSLVFKNAKSKIIRLNNLKINLMDLEANKDINLCLSYGGESRGGFNKPVYALHQALTLCPILYTSKSFSKVQRRAQNVAVPNF